MSGFRGLLRFLQAELQEEHRGEYLRLGLEFNTLDATAGDPIRFTLTKIYDAQLPYAWCVADLCEYALLHEVQEAVPSVFHEPDHRPGELDRPELWAVYAARSRARFEHDLTTRRWDQERLGELKQVWPSSSTDVV